MVFDMYDHETIYDPKRHGVPRLYWSDGRLCYWGWIYDGEKIVGDFTADTVQAAEKAFGVKFKCD